MLIFRNIDPQIEGTWIERTLWGAPVRFKVRPRTERLIEDIRKRHKSRKNGKEVFNEDRILDDIVDYILADFDGFGEEIDGVAQPMTATLENKKKVLDMSVPFGETPNRIFVLDHANRLGFDLREDEEKNSAPSSADISAASEATTT